MAITSTPTDGRVVSSGQELPPRPHPDDSHSRLINLLLPREERSRYARGYGCVGHGAGEW